MRNDFNELHAAEIFVQVVRAHGFANAAHTLGRNPSTLSRAVAELERHLGVQLLTRTTRRLHLTEAGSLYLHHAEALLTAQREAHDALASLSGGVPRGRLRATMPVVVGERLLGPQLPRFHGQYPELRLELELSDRPVPLIQGGFDLALRIGRLMDSSLRAQRLSTVERLLVASPDYLARQGVPTTPAELPQHPCITLGYDAAAVEWSFCRGDEVHKQLIEGWLHCSSTPLAIQAAVAGLGLLRVSAWAVRDDLHQGRLVPVLSDYRCDRPGAGLGLYALYAQTTGTPLPLKSRLFVSFVQEVLAGAALV